LSSPPPHRPPRLGRVNGAAHVCGIMMASCRVMGARSLADLVWMAEALELHPIKKSPS